MISKSFIMPKNNLTLVDNSMPLNDALNLIESGNLLSLPVVESSKFIGVVSKEKILQHLMKDEASQLTAGEIARKDIPGLHLEDDVEEAAELLANTNTPFVAVNDDDEEFIGIITHKTIFRHYAQIFGINKGHKLVINTYDIKGRLALLTEILSREDANIISLVIDNPGAAINMVKIIVRVETDNIEAIKKAIEDAGFSVRQ